MDRSSTLRLRLIRLNVVLLVSASIICLHGNPIAGDHDLHCVNDYLFTVNCTLSLKPSENTSGSNSSYWLDFTETFEPKTFQCMLTNTDRDCFCSVKTSDLTPDSEYPEMFTDTDTFKISLCHNQTDGSKMCEELDGEYTPQTNIKPNAPCGLTFSNNSGQHHFTWSSTYEEYEPYTGLVNSFKYQLHYFRRGDEHDDNEVISRDIYTERTNYSVDDHVFVPDSDYAASVRSSPNMVFYQGEWSDWSDEVHWRSAMNDLPRNTFITGLGMKVFITLCVLVPLILLMCYAPVKIWRQSAFIPTPAPYFHTLYSNCQGDFKSWVITQEGTADMLKAEAMLQIDTLTPCADVPEDKLQPHFHHRLMEGSVYSNLINTECDTSHLVPYAVNTMEPLSAPGSLTLSSQPGSPAEGDSGCWLCSDSSLEKDSPWYFSKYCTLSSLTQTSPFTAEHHGSLSTKCSSQQIISMDATGETQ
ncbi:interleukin-21 receptor [Hippoglossus stenolepis]|uniref:interleukin-21 receptor n=1 Tax=Hippoglossus stenolepis TaxID=195615 RepID=UPI001FAE98E3|nr:interleukin-21 receptor [Hippoglossus stenolepis]